MADRDAKGRQAKGDRHWSRIHPERLNPPRGAAHYRYGKPEVTQGEKNPYAKLSDATVVEIRARLAAGAIGCKLADEYGVCKQTISLVKRRLLWSHI
jgi:hypothetical protein